MFFHLHHLFQSWFTRDMMSKIIDDSALLIKKKKNEQAVHSFAVRSTAVIFFSWKNTLINLVLQCKGLYIL